MVLKDWKDRGNGKFVSNISGVVIEVFKLDVGNWGWAGYTNEFAGLSSIRKEDFKSKSEALASAKDYMRSH